MAASANNRRQMALQDARRWAYQANNQAEDMLARGCLTLDNALAVSSVMMRLADIEGWADDDETPEPFMGFTP